MRQLLLWILSAFGVKEQKVPPPVECKAPKWENVNGKKSKKK